MRQCGGADRTTSPKHQANMQAIAREVFGKATLERGMDRALDDKIAPEVCAVFGLTARCNHSCQPNAQVCSQEFADAYIDVKALEDIEKGQELLISYIPTGSPSMSSTVRRQRELQAKYLFVCDCVKCSIP